MSIARCIYVLHPTADENREKAYERDIFDSWAEAWAFASEDGAFKPGYAIEQFFDGYCDHEEHVPRGEGCIHAVFRRIIIDDHNGRTGAEGAGIGPLRARFEQAAGRARHTG